jgi:hypothetical protein
LQRLRKACFAVLAAVSLAGALIACGDDTVDANEIEAGIEQDLSSTTAKVISVSCPEDVEKKEGQKFTCDAKLEGGGKAKVVVTLTNDRGDAVYSFKPGTVQVSDNTVEPVLEDDLAAAGVPSPKVDCPELIKVADGQQATCTATGGGGRTGEITFTWSSDSGEIDGSSVEGPSPQ